MDDASKKRLVILSICFFVFLLLSGALIVFLNSKSKTKNDVEYKEEETTTKEVVKIKITDDLKLSLRNIIPRLSDSNCANEYYYKQFNDSTFKETDFTSEMRNEACENILKVYHMEYKIETSNENIYLYDYILLSDGINFGMKYNELNIPRENIEMINTETGTIPSEVAFKSFGKVYKYSFKYLNNAYMYIDTSVYNK